MRQEEQDRDRPLDAPQQGARHRSIPSRHRGVPRRDIVSDPWRPGPVPSTGLVRRADPTSCRMTPVPDDDRSAGWRRTPPPPLVAIAPRRDGSMRPPLPGRRAVASHRRRSWDLELPRESRPSYDGHCLPASGLFRKRPCCQRATVDFGQPQVPRTIGHDAAPRAKPQPRDLRENGIIAAAKSSQSGDSGWEGCSAERDFAGARIACGRRKSLARKGLRGSWERDVTTGCCAGIRMGGLDWRGRRPEDRPLRCVGSGRPLGRFTRDSTTGVRRGAAALPHPWDPRNRPRRVPAGVPAIATIRESVRRTATPREAHRCG